MFRLVGQLQTNQGLAVIGVSLTISFLTLPLYQRADAVQQKQRDAQKSMAHWINHIKKTFKGDERFMMLQTYYRENNYSPLSNPLLFLVNSTCYAIGFFLLWAGIIRYILPDTLKQIFDCIMWIVAGVFLIDYMCFGRNLGNLSAFLTFTNGLNISRKENRI